MSCGVATFALDPGEDDLRLADLLVVTVPVVWRPLTPARRRLPPVPSLTGRIVSLRPLPRSMLGESARPRPTRNCRKQPDSSQIHAKEHSALDCARHTARVVGASM